jgi:hypothetical protein
LIKKIGLYAIKNGGKISLTVTNDLLTLSFRTNGSLAPRNSAGIAVSLVWQQRFSAFACTNILYLQSFESLFDFTIASQDLFVGICLRCVQISGVAFRIYPLLKEITGLSIQNLAVSEDTGVLIEVTAEISNECIQCMGHDLPFCVSAKTPKAVSA